MSSGLSPSTLRRIFEKSDYGRTKWPRPFVLPALLGIFVAGLLSFALSLYFRGRSSQTLVPFGFIIIIIVIAKAFGRTAGVLSTASAALIFAISLFRPLGSVVIVNGLARLNLSWMILAGMTLSYFLGKEKPS